MAKDNVSNADLVFPSSFKPKLISGAEFTFFKEDERGRFYLMKNPENSKYLKLDESGKSATQLLDGSRTLDEIDVILKKSWEFDAGKFIEVLARNGFLENVKIQKEKKTSEPYSFQIAVLKADSKFLQKTCYHLRNIYGKRFFTIAPIVSIVFLTFFVLNAKNIFTDAFTLFSYETPVLPFLLALVIFFVTEFCHEFAHIATACNYGCKPGEMGLEFNFGIPLFYAKTLDVRSHEVAKNIRVFLAGPLTTVLIAGFFTILYILTPVWNYLWADLAFFHVLSSLITMSPFIKTDGYYVVQSVLKFPNLFSHSMRYISHIIKRTFKIMSKKDYDEYMDTYSNSERRILKVYSWTSLIGIVSLVLIFVVTLIQMRVIQVILLTGDLLYGQSQAYTLKQYVLWGFYMMSLFFSLVGVTILLAKNLKRRSSAKSIPSMTLLQPK
jgi:hypothetical protein